MCPSVVSNLSMILLGLLCVSKEQKYFEFFSPSNKLVAQDLMTAPFTVVCLNSVNSNLSFSSSCMLSSFKFCFGNFLSLLITSPKQPGPRAGPTNVVPDLGSNCL